MLKVGYLPSLIILKEMRKPFKILVGNPSPTEVQRRSQGPKLRTDSSVLPYPTPVLKFCHGKAEALARLTKAFPPEITESKGKVFFFL